LTRRKRDVNKMDTTAIKNRIKRHNAPDFGGAVGAAEPELIIDLLQHAQQVLILVEDGSLITGNNFVGFDWLVGDEIPEQAMLGLASTMLRRDVD
jgi:hypothetical protein